MNIETTEVKYTKIYTGNEVTEVKVEVRVPASDGDVSGYVKLGSIEGWALSDNDTKLTKVYTHNQTDIITLQLVEFNGILLDNATTMESIEIYDINDSKYLRVNVEYTKEEYEEINTLVSANIIISIKNDYVDSYVISKNNTEWTVSEDGTFATKEVTMNENYMNTVVICPTGVEETEENVIKENITYSVSCVGLMVTGARVSVEEQISEEEVIGSKVNITVPYSLDGVTGYAILGDVDGWILSKDKRKLSKNFYKNETVTISIPVIEANGYIYENFNLSENIVINTINYKKIVKGRCETTRCLYDVYTKSEMDNRSLKIEQKFEEMAGEYRILTKEYVFETEGYNSYNVDFNFPDSTWTTENTRIIEARATYYNKRSTGEYVKNHGHILPEASSLITTNNYVQTTQIIICADGNSPSGQKADISIATSRDYCTVGDKMVYELLIMKVR